MIGPPTSGARGTPVLSTVAAAIEAIEAAAKENRSASVNLTVLPNVVDELGRLGWARTRCASRRAANGAVEERIPRQVTALGLTSPGRRADRLDRTFALCCAIGHDRIIMLNDLPNPPHSRSPSAKRMARHRERRRNGMRCITVELREVEIAFLIRSQFLEPEDRADPIALRNAMHRWLDRVCP